MKLIKDDERIVPKVLASSGRRNEVGMPLQQSYNEYYGEVLPEPEGYSVRSSFDHEK